MDPAARCGWRSAGRIADATVTTATKSPIAFEALQQIGRLYAVEAQIHGRSADERLAARREHSRPIVDALKTWLSAQLERISGKSSLAEAIRYALRHWDGLSLFLADGCIELDTKSLSVLFEPSP